MNTRKRTAHESNQLLIAHKRQHCEETEDNAATIAVPKPSDITCQASRVVAQLERALRNDGNSSDAAAMKKYMRGKFEFFGVKSPRRRELCKDVFSQGNWEDLQNSQLRGFVTMLWEKPQRELQQTALDFLERHKKKICSEADEFNENMAFFKTLILAKSWWDTVDMLASKLVGYLVQTHPNRGKAVMEEWITADDMWLRRTAILHQLRSKADTDSDLLFRFCLARCHEEEFFIRKAIGWSLREYARMQPNQVKQFLKNNKNDLSKLSYNEASKHLKMAKKVK